MKKLLLVITAVAVSVVCYSALPKWQTGDPNVVTTNNVEYTRRGSMSTKDYVATDVATTNMLQRGYNSFGWDDNEDYDYVPMSVWKDAEIVTNELGEVTKVVFYVKDNKGNFILDGGNKIPIPTAMLICDYGLELMNTYATNSIDKFGYTHVGPYGIMSNMPFSYGTNRVCIGKSVYPQYEFAKDFDKSKSEQNGNLIVCDRAWVTNLLIKAGIKTKDEIEAALSGM